jgi:hypothetical protein
VNKIRYFFIAIFFTIISVSSFAQIGGNSVYKFLNLSSSARTAAMGGNFLAVKDGDLTQAFFNPSIIQPSMDNNLAISYVDYFSDVNYGFASYAKSFNKIGTYHATVQYINYGQFTYADETGQTYGTFTANEVALAVGWGRSLDSLFSIGANMKFIYSGLEQYQSYGLAVDVAGTYHNPKNDFTMSLLFRNIGVQLRPYVSGYNEPLPFEIDFGLSQKLKHLPFRYSILLTNLQKWDLTYFDPDDPDNKVDPITGETEEESGFAKFGDQFMRHVVVGGEFIPSKYFMVRIGYNYQRRKELGNYNKMGMVGFSWGLGLRISKFQIDYSRATYQLHTSPNYITLRVNLSAFGK